MYGGAERKLTPESDARDKTSLTHSAVYGNFLQQSGAEGILIQLPAAHCLLEINSIRALLASCILAGCSAFSEIQFSAARWNGCVRRFRSALFCVVFAWLRSHLTRLSICAHTALWGLEKKCLALRRALSLCASVFFSAAPQLQRGCLFL